MGLSRSRLVELPAAAWRGLRRIGTASWATRFEYVTVVILACVTEVAVRTVPLVRLARAYGVTYAAPAEPALPAATPPSAPLEALPDWAARRMRVAVRVMRRWPVQGECLRHGLVAGQRLRALHPELKLGVAKEGAGIVAHAWLVVGGLTLDPTAARYAELPSPRI